MGFGLLFGSVFAREDIIAAWWLHPLERPVALLGAAIAFGVAILATGLALAAMQAHWRGAGRSWWVRDAGLVLTYAALLATVAGPARSGSRPRAQSGMYRVRRDWPTAGPPVRRSRASRNSSSTCSSSS